MAKRDYYEVLGLSKSASADEIRTAHRKLVRKYHPDVNKNNKAAEEKFKEVQEAYDVLSDEHKRKGYDQFGHAGVGAGGAGPGGVDPAMYEAYRRAQQGRGGQSWQGGGVTVEDFDLGGGNAEFGDIFEQLFGAGKSRRGGRGARGPVPQPEPTRGSDIEYPITLSFEDAARGKTLPLQIRRGGHMESIDIKIPPGVKDASRIRVKGKGEEGGGEQGDLFIITRIAPHPYYRRDGLDVLVDVPISVYEALLGTKVEVPTLDGPVTITIPPGTGSGAKLRIKERGIHRGTEKGDEYVVVKIVVPKGLDADDKELIAKLQEKQPVNARADVKW